MLKHQLELFATDYIAETVTTDIIWVGAHTAQVLEVGKLAVIYNQNFV